MLTDKTSVGSSGVISEAGRAVLGFLSEISPCTLSDLLARAEIKAKGQRWLLKQLRNLKNEGLIEIKDEQISLTAGGATALSLYRIADLKRASEESLVDVPKRATQRWDVSSSPFAVPSSEKDTYASLSESRIAPEAAYADCCEQTWGLEDRIARLEPNNSEVPLEQQVVEAGWLVENIPRRMRAHVPVDVEIRVSKDLTPRFVSGLIGQALPILHDIDVAPAMSLRLTCT